MRIIGKTALWSAALFGVYAAITLGSDWWQLKRFWRKHTGENGYDPEKDIGI